MKKNLKYIVSFAVLSALALPFISGCNSSGTHGGGRDDDSDVFVADDDTAGRIELTVASNSIAVGGTSSFSALVYDANGVPVPNINVICDSEAGVAIIEPSRGYEMTDSYGHMSGIVGCETPGSFQMLCRLPAGSSARKFASIKCTGSGTASWPNSAGGGLGGDVAGGTGGTASDLRISNVTFNDGNQTSTMSIDTVREISCNDGTKEPWTNTSVNFTVVNKTPSDVVFNRFTYTISGGVSDSGEIMLIGDVPVARNGSSAFSSEFLTTAKKTSFGSPLELSTVSFTLYGTTESGDTVTASGSVTAAISGVDRCPNVKPSASPTTSPNE